jgi:TPR repeat protein
VEKSEMGNVQSITPEFCEDWYEAIILKQPDGVDLGDRERETFNHAFESYLAGSYDEALEGFTELSKQNSSVGQYYLGLMYLTGLGVLQDFTQAHMWLNIASSHGHKKARMHLEQLTHNMTAELIAEAQKQARRWVTKKTKEAESPPIQQDEPETRIG